MSDVHNRMLGHRDKKQSDKSAVLVGVLKSRRDLRLLLHEHWYRIPASFVPKREFAYVAFYQPAVFKRGGKCVRYYAKVVRKRIVRRIDILPDESHHLRAQESYVHITFKRIEKLSKPIRNIIPRRITFGFTTMGRLLSSGDILELYGVPATERMVKKSLEQRGLKVVSEYGVSGARKRYRIDLAVPCKTGKIAIECDNEKAHGSKVQKARDKAKDRFLRRRGWRVVRLEEKEIIESLDACADRIQKAVVELGGQ